MKLMVIILVALGFSLFSWAGDGGGESGYAPQTRDVDRYRLIWERSPFVVGQPAPASEGSAGRFALTGMAALQDEPVVFVLDRKSLSRVMVTREPNSMGMSLVSVQRDADPLKSEAIIRVGPEQIRIAYDPEAMKTPDVSPALPSQQTVSANEASAPASGVPRPARTIRRPTTIKLTN
jgi:hypothetical protein